MARTFYKSVKNSIKYWWIPLIIGIIFIGAGIFSFFTPLTAYTTLAIIFSITFLFSGIFEVVFSLSNKDELDNWGWTFAFGLVTAIVGVYLVFNPLLSLEIFAYYIGFLVLFRSISAISLSLDLKQYGVSDWGMSMFVGVIGVILGLILLFNPILAGMTAVFWAGLAFITVGFFAISFALSLRKIKKAPSKISQELRDRYEAIRKEIEHELKD